MTKESANHKESTLAKRAGQYSIGKDLRVIRLGFGSMRLTGKGIWGQPADRSEAISVLQRAVELGINFIDTADSYGPARCRGINRRGLASISCGSGDRH